MFIGETNDINQKDRFFAMKGILQDELDELHKTELAGSRVPLRAYGIQVWCS